MVEKKHFLKIQVNGKPEKRLLSFGFGKGVKGLGKEKLDSCGVDEEEGG